MPTAMRPPEAPRPLDGRTAPGRATKGVGSMYEMAHRTALGFIAGRPALGTDQTMPKATGTELVVSEPTAGPSGRPDLARCVSPALIDDAAPTIDQVARDHGVATIDVVESAVIGILEDLLRQVHGD